jgi:hypothetical protein
MICQKHYFAVSEKYFSCLFLKEVYRFGNKKSLRVTESFL